MARQCPWPSKVKLTRAQAKRRMHELNHYAYDGRAVHAYHCPAGGHYHVGHRPVRRR